MAARRKAVKMSLDAINVAVLFQYTQEFAEANNYIGLPQEPPPSSFSPKAEAVGRILKAAERGGDSFGCKTALVHKLVSAIMADDPIPPLADEDKYYSDNGLWGEDIDTYGYGAKWLLFAVEDDGNGPGLRKGELVLKDNDSEMNEEGLMNVQVKDGTRTSNDWLAWECVRPATFEECRTFAWQFANKGAPPKTFQPAPKPVKKVKAVKKAT